MQEGWIGFCSRLFGFSRFGGSGFFGLGPGAWDSRNKFRDKATHFSRMVRRCWPLGSGFREKGLDFELRAVAIQT